MELGTSMNGFHSIDLHIHSCYSEDGQYTPAELLQMCADAGITIMAIADHNCVKGAQQAVRLAKQSQISCHPAIEIDCTFQDRNFHVLGYGINLHSTDFEAIEQNIRRQCIAASQERLRLINRLGLGVTAAELAAAVTGAYWDESWTGEVFAEVLLSNPLYLEHPLLAPYRRGASRGDNPYLNFHLDYFSQGKPCYASITYPAMKDVIELIHRNGGQAVLAHPGANLAGAFHEIDQLIPLGLDGIEAYSSHHTPETARWFFHKAQQRGLFVTRGSDFHGKIKPAVRLGYCSSAGTAR